MALVPLFHTPFSPILAITAKRETIIKRDIFYLICAIYLYYKKTSYAYENCQKYLPFNACTRYIYEG